MADYPATPKAPSLRHDRDDDAHELSIQCIAESHAQRPWFVASFYIAVRKDTGEPIWLESRRYYRGGKAIAEIPNRSRVYLIDDAPKTDEDFSSDITRSRFRFTCGICGIDRPARGEKLFPVLDRLAANGVSEISLEGLVGILE